jgi:ribosomal protein S1
LSRRALLEREQEEQKRKFLAELQPGQIHEGVVRSVKDFGAFGDMGGVDGLIHISQLSWDRIKHPSEVVQEGQKVRVRVEKYDEQTGKISLSYRDLLDRPWDDAEQNFPPGTTARGTVSRLANFGAFVRLGPGIEGLIHISELAHGRVRRVEDVLKEGQEVEVKILSVDPEAQRIALSFKATLAAPEGKGQEREEESDEPPRPLAVTAKNRPLRGGMDRKNDGGAGLGLNW